MQMSCVGNAFHSLYVINMHIQVVKKISVYETFVNMVEISYFN